MRLWRRRPRTLGEYLAREQPARRERLAKQCDDFLVGGGAWRAAILREAEAIVQEITRQESHED